MTQHHKDIENNVYGFKPKNIEVVEITIEEARELSKPIKTLESQTSLTNSECTLRIESHWDQVGQRNVSIGDIYTVEQEAGCKNWIIANRTALSSILTRDDILDIDVTDNQYWPEY